MQSQAVISSSGLFHPKDIIDNDTLVASYNEYAETYNTKHAQSIQTGKLKALELSSAAFILKASGIKQRYVVDKNGILDIQRMRPFIPKRDDAELSLQAEMAVKAIENCLQETSRSPSDIDCLLLACSGFQRPYPAISIEVQQALKMKGFALDLNVACSSATFALSMANDMINAGTARSVLVVNPEICSAHLNFTNRESHFIFGDASTAVLVEHQDHTSSNHLWKIKSCRLATQFSNNIRNNHGILNDCEVENGKTSTTALFHQQGKKVFKEVVPMAFGHIVSHCEDHQLNSQDIKRYWLHQANSHMNQLIAKKLLGEEPSLEQAPTILDTYANTASCGSIIAFHLYQQSMQAKDFGLICSFGAGYSVGSLLLEKM